MIRQDTVDLLWSPSVEISQACLNVADWDVELDRSERSGERGVRVTIDHHSVWAHLLEHPLDALEHAPCGLPVPSRTGLKIVVRLG